METVVYDKSYFDIPLQDMADAGNIMVCHDPKNRLGDSERTVVTWSVVKTKSDEGGSLPIALGVFWDKKMAVIFANALCEL